MGPRGLGPIKQKVVDHHRHHHHPDHDQKEVVVAPGVRPGPALFFGSRPGPLALDHHDHDHDDDDHDQDDDDITNKDITKDIHKTLGASAVGHCFSAGFLVSRNK